MHYILWVGIPHLYVSALAEGGLEHKCVVVHHRKTVLDLSITAEARGVYVGMSLAEAKAILSSDAAYVVWEEEPYRLAQQKWLDVCTEFTNVIEPESQHSAFLDLSAHPDPRSIVAELRTALAVSGFGSITGGAGCRWVAKLSGLMGDEDEVALRMPHQFVGHLSIDRLPIPQEQKARLALLGYRRISELNKVPLETFQSQFGAGAYEILRAANGRGEAKVKPSYPPDRLSVRFTFDSAPNVREIVDIGLLVLAKQMGLCLQERDQVGKCARLTFEFEEGKPELRERTFTKPLCDVQTVLVALELLTALWPEHPVTGLQLSLPDLHAANRKQVQLSNGNGEQKEGAVALAMQRVRHVFGDSVVRSGAQEVPRVAFLRAFKDAIGWR